MISTEPGKSEEAKHLRSNVHLGLNNGSIFLSPSIVNVQTLATLAIHGEDFASPTQSWMLVGHACRQAEALALHRPARADSDEEQRRLCLFWLLFIIDKGCSLAFGRTPSLPTAVHRNTPFPDEGYLSRHSPHVSQASDRIGQSSTSVFSSEFFIKGFELTKLVGSILETDMLIESRPEKPNKHQLKADLDHWYLNANAVSLRVCPPDTMRLD